MNNIGIQSFDSGAQTVHATVDGFLESLTYVRLIEEIEHGARCEYNGTEITSRSLRTLNAKRQRTSDQ